MVNSGKTMPGWALGARVKFSAHPQIYWVMLGETFSSRIHQLLICKLRMNNHFFALAFCLKCKPSEAEASTYCWQLYRRHEIFLWIAENCIISAEYLIFCKQSSLGPELPHALSTAQQGLVDPAIGSVAEAQLCIKTFQQQIVPVSLHRALHG